MRLRFQADGAVQVRIGKVELGQGITTALAQIAADALGIAIDRVQMLSADTAHGPDEGMTSGSQSVQVAGAALAKACAEARAQGLVPVLASARTDAAPATGQSVPRRDLPAKLAGQPVFIHDLNPPGLLHGRVLHPPRPGARLLRADTATAQASPGLHLLHQDGPLFGLLAERSRDADRALTHLVATVQWAPADPAEQAAAQCDPRQSAVLYSRTVASQGERPAEGVCQTVRATYRKPWIAHASIAPSCALALWGPSDAARGDGVQLQVWSHSQGIFNLRRDLALAFDLPSDAVRVVHADGAGCYGHNGADDVAFDAAWLARQVPGRPVRLLWRREDELTRAPLGPAMVVALEADLDAKGQVLHWRHQLWSAGHSQRPGRSDTPALLGCWQTATPFEPPPSIDMPMAVGGGAERNAVPGYALPAFEVLAHRVAAPLRSSALRSLGAFANVFAVESFVDELAAATGQDALAWRRQHLAHDPRALAVLNQAVAMAGRPLPAPAQGMATGVGQGLAVARYKGTGAWCAVVAEVEAGAALRVCRLVIAVDVGLAVNPDGVVAQIEGGAIQATSWALKEAVQFDAERITSDSWAAYPILRFSDVPAVDVHLMPSDEPSLGAGEAALGPTVAAIANALCQALGVRVRQLPLTPAHIVAAMDDAPSAP